MATIPNLQLTPELQQKREQMLKTRGLTTLGFYDQLMAYPELFEHVEALGSYVRFHSVLPRHVYEAEVLMVAAELNSPFERATHVKSAQEAGVTEELQQAIAQNASLPPELAELRAVVRHVVRQESVPQPAFDMLLMRYGVQGAVEVVALAAMYRMFASLGAAFDSGG